MLTLTPFLVQSGAMRFSFRPYVRELRVLHLRRKLSWAEGADRTMNGGCEMD